jgi:hypothetical protein
MWYMYLIHNDNMSGEVYLIPPITWDIELMTTYVRSYGIFLNE